MKKWKRFLGVILAGTMLIALVACGQQSTPQTPDADGSQQSADGSQESGDQSQGENSSVAGGKTLVVYYSATGNTEAVAGYIANAAGGDLFEITPTQPYTSDDLNWSDESSRVSREHDDPSLRTVELTADTVDNWDEYDTVFIGYPIWWGIAAWPVDSFVSANDFSGKTVIPFATSSSSSMGDSGDLLADLAGTGDWREGQRFSSSANEADVADWINGLGLAN